jgi:hypothetical protein
MDTLIQYPKEITVYITRSTLSSISTNLSKHKFTVSPTITIGVLKNYLRRLLKLNNTVPLFLFVNNTLQTSNTSIAELYTNYKSINNEIYMIYATDFII